MDKYAIQQWRYSDRSSLEAGRGSGRQARRFRQLNN
jgi:hypothetical protein